MRRFPAAVTVITKSGTNQFKGSALEYFNNQKMNANAYYFGSAAVPPKLPVKMNNYGATVGGPIRLIAHSALTSKGVFLRKDDARRVAIEQSCGVE